MKIHEKLLIKEVFPLEEKRLRLVLNTGSELVLNMANRLDTNRFCPLKDDRIFNSVTTDGYYLHFDTVPNYALDFTLKEAMQMSISTPTTSNCKIDEAYKDKNENPDEI